MADYAYFRENILSVVLEKVAKADKNSDGSCRKVYIADLTYDYNENRGSLLRFTREKTFKALTELRAAGLINFRWPAPELDFVVLIDKVQRPSDVYVRFASQRMAKHLYKDSTIAALEKMQNTRRKASPIAKRQKPHKRGESVTPK